MIAMKITLETPMKMVITDKNYTSFLMGIVFILAGGWYAVSFGLQNVVPFVISIGFALVGVYMVATTKLVTIILDKLSDKGTINFHSILKQETKEFAISKIKKLNFRSVLEINHTMHHGSERTNRYYHYLLEFELDAGEVLSIDFGKASANAIHLFTSSPQEKKIQEATEIAEFLGLPLNEIKTTPPSEDVFKIKIG